MGVREWQCRPSVPLRVCSAWLQAESGPGSRRRGREQTPAPAQVIGHRREPDLQARLGQAEPAHPAQAVGPLPGAEHLLDPGPHPAHFGVVRLQPRQRLRATPGARVDDARRSTTSPDDGLGSAAREGAVAVCVPGYIRKDGVQLGRVVDVGGRDLDRSDQSRVLDQRGSEGFRVLLVVGAAAGRRPAMPKKDRVTLTAEEREELDRLLSRGKADVRCLKHAQMLLKADEAEGGPGWSDERIADAFDAGVATIERLRQRFVEEGLQAALPTDRTGTRLYERKLDGAQEAHLIALACSAPPEGQARWTLRLLARQMVELAYVDTLSYETVRQTLKKERPQTAPEKDVVYSRQALG